MKQIGYSKRKRLLALFLMVNMVLQILAPSLVMAKEYFIPPSEAPSPRQSETLIQVPEEGAIRELGDLFFLQPLATDRPNHLEVKLRTRANQAFLVLHKSVKLDEPIFYTKKKQEEGMENPALVQAGQYSLVELGWSPGQAQEKKDYRLVEFTWLDQAGQEAEKEIPLRLSFKDQVLGKNFFEVREKNPNLLDLDPNLERKNDKALYLGDGGQADLFILRQDPQDPIQEGQAEVYLQVRAKEKAKPAKDPLPSPGPGKQEAQEKPGQATQPVQKEERPLFDPQELRPEGQKEEKKPVLGQILEDQVQAEKSPLLIEGKKPVQEKEPIKEILAPLLPEKDKDQKKLTDKLDQINKDPLFDLDKILGPKAEKKTQAPLVEKSPAKAQATPLSPLEERPLEKASSKPTGLVIEKGPLAQKKDPVIKLFNLEGLGGKKTLADKLDKLKAKPIFDPSALRLENRQARPDLAGLGDPLLDLKKPEEDKKAGRPDLAELLDPRAKKPKLDLDQIKEILQKNPLSGKKDPVADVALLDGLAKDKSLVEKLDLAKALDLDLGLGLVGPKKEAKDKPALKVDQAIEAQIKPEKLLEKKSLADKLEAFNLEIGDDFRPEEKFGLRSMEEDQMPGLGLARFASLPPAESNASYNTSTDPGRTTIGSNNGFYKVDISDFHYFVTSQGAFSAEAKATFGIRLPRGAKAGDKFTLTLPRDFALYGVLNHPDPIIKLLDSEDNTKVLATIKYRGGSPASPDTGRPNVRDLAHYLEGEVTAQGQEVLAKTAYRGDVVFGNTYTMESGGRVDDQPSYGQLKYDRGVQIIANHWTSDNNNRTSITKTFDFESAYKNERASLQDQASLRYSQGVWDTAHFFNYLHIKDYYQAGDPIDKVRRVQGGVINAGKRPTTRREHIFTEGPATDINVVRETGYTLYEALSSDQQIGSFGGSGRALEKIASKAEIASSPGPFDGKGIWVSNNGQIIKIKRDQTGRARVLYLEQDLEIQSQINPVPSIQPGQGGESPQTGLLDQKISRYTQDFQDGNGNRTHNQTTYMSKFTAEAKMTPVNEVVIAKIAREDRDKDGQEESYLVDHDSARFSLYNVTGTPVFPVADNLSTQGGFFTLSENQVMTYEGRPKGPLQRGKVYMLQETRPPRGFSKPNNNYVVYFIINEDGSVRYQTGTTGRHLSARELNQSGIDPYTSTSLGNGQSAYNGGYIPFVDKRDQKNSLTLTKTDASSGQRLPGAVFRIINLETGETYTRTSNRQGQITLAHRELPDGSYKIEEIQAPPGYQLGQGGQSENFWILGGNYYRTDPKTSANAVGRFENGPGPFRPRSLETDLDSPSEVSDQGSFLDGIFDALSFLGPEEVLAAGVNPGGPQTVGRLTTAAPQIRESLAPSFKQVFYLNKEGATITPSPSNLVFSLYADNLQKTSANSWRPTNSPSSALINNYTDVRVYKVSRSRWGNIQNLPANPNDFVAQGNNIEEITDIQKAYNPRTKSYQVNLGNRLDDKNAYVVVVKGDIQRESEAPVLTGAALINKTGGGFPIITLPNSGSVVNTRMDRKKAQLIIYKYDMTGQAIDGTSFELKNKYTQKVYRLSLLENDGQGSSTARFAQEAQLPPGTYVLRETATGNSSYAQFQLPQENWEFVIEDTNGDGQPDLRLLTPSRLIKKGQSNGADYVSLEVYNEPVKKQGSLRLNLFEQDGRTPLTKVGANFVLRGPGISDLAFSKNGNVFSLELPTDFSPGDYTLVQNGLPADEGGSYSNDEAQWKISISQSQRDGRWYARLKRDYNFIKPSQSTSPGDNTFDVLNRKPSQARSLELPPSYGQVKPGTLQNLSFTMTNSKDNTGQFILKKVDQENNPLLGATFRLTGSNGYTRDIRLINTAEITVGNLPLGRYTLREISPPQGYTASETSWTIEIVEENGQVLSKIYEAGNNQPIGTGSLPVLSVTNTKPGEGEGEFIVNKVDDSQPAQPLEGVEFTLYSDSGLSTVFQRQTSDQNGQARFTGLQRNTTYYLKETRGKDGYSQVNTIWIVTVDGSGSVSLSPVEAGQRSASLAQSLANRSLLFTRQEEPRVRPLSLGLRNSILSPSLGDLGLLEISPVETSPLALRNGGPGSVQNDRASINKSATPVQGQKGLYNVQLTVEAKEQEVNTNQGANYIFILQNDKTNMGSGNKNKGIALIKNFLRVNSGNSGSTFSIVYHDPAPNNSRLAITKKLVIEGKTSLPITDWNKIPDIKPYNGFAQLYLKNALDNTKTSIVPGKKNILINLGYSQPADLYDQANQIKNELRSYDKFYVFVGKINQSYDFIQEAISSKFVLANNNEASYNSGLQEIKRQVDQVLGQAPAGPSGIRNASITDSFDASKFDLVGQIHTTKGNLSNANANPFTVSGINLDPGQTATVSYQLRIKEAYHNGGQHSVNGRSSQLNLGTDGSLNFPNPEITAPQAQPDPPPEPEKTQVSARASWKPSNAETIPKAISLDLYQTIGGVRSKVEGQTKILQGSSWSTLWTDLATQTEDGRAISYDVDLTPGQNLGAWKMDKTQETNNFSFAFSQTSQITVVNPKAKGGFEINKVNKDGQILPGAQFSLVKVDENERPLTGDQAFKAQGSTDGQGKLAFNNLAPGSYKLTETQAPEGYEKSPDTWLITVAGDGKTTVKRRLAGLSQNEAKAIQIQKSTGNHHTGYSKIGNITVKLDWSHIPANERNLVGFSIKGSSNVKGSETTFNNNYLGLSYNPFYLDGGEDLETMSLNNLRLTSRVDIDPSRWYEDWRDYPIDYLIKLSYNPKGFKVNYQYSEDQVYITLFKSDGLTDLELGENNSFDIVNEEKKVDIEFTKKGPSQEDPSVLGVLPGVEFQLLKLKDQGDPKQEADFLNIGEPVVSDEAGKISFTGLASGHYKLKETKALDGYYNPGIVREFKVEKGKVSFIKSIVQENDVNFDGNTIINEKIKEIPLKIVKKSDDGSVLAGIQFKLEGGNLSQALIGESNEQGEVIFGGYPNGLKLMQGLYYLTETKGLPGYILDDRPRAIIVSGDFTIPEVENSRDLTEKITMDSRFYFVGDEITENQAQTIRPNRSEGIRIDTSFDFSQADIKPGDHFKLYLSKNLTPQGDYDTERLKKDLVIGGANGILASGKYIEEDDGNRYIKFTFTNFANLKLDKAKMSKSFFIDRKAVKTSQNDTTIRFGGSSSSLGGQTRTIHVDYSPTTTGLVTDIGSFITYQDTQTGDFTQVIYFNKAGNSLYSSKVSLKADGDNSSLNLTQANTQVEVYRVISNKEVAMPQSWGIDLADSINRGYIEKLTKQASITKGELSLDLGTYKDGYTYEDSSPYIVIVRGKYDLNSTNDLRTIAEVNSNYYNGYGNFVEGNGKWVNVNVLTPISSDASGKLEIVITNSKNEIEFTKVDGTKIENEDQVLPEGMESPLLSSQDTPLQGAQFELRKEGQNGTFTKVEGSEKTTLEDGKFGWKGLTQGEYEVWETKAPEGYVIRDKVASFTVNDKGEITNIKDKEGKDLAGNMTIENFKAEYPMTGGPGTLAFTLAGTGLMALAYWAMKKRQRAWGGGI